MRLAKSEGIAVILVGLAEGRFPEAHPDRPAWQYWFASAVTAVVFLLSLLVIGASSWAGLSARFGKRGG